MSKKQKKTLVRIILSAVLLVAAALIPVDGIVKLVLFLIPYAVIGWDVLWKAIRNIAHGQVFDENFLMAIATVGAFALGEYPEGVAVMLFYQVGELFQSYAVGRSRQSIAALMDIRPDYANIEQDGKLVQVDPEDVAVGDTIVIKAGEKIPLDGVVLEGSSAVDTAALTGESLPRDVDRVYGRDLEGPLCQGTGLVKHHRLGLGQRLQIVAALDQNALLGGPADPAEKAERHRDDQRARARNHQEDQCALQPIAPIAPEEQRR